MLTSPNPFYIVRHMNSYYRSTPPEELTPNEQAETASKTQEILDQIMRWQVDGITRDNARGTLICWYDYIYLRDAAEAVTRTSLQGVSADTITRILVNDVYPKHRFSAITSAVIERRAEKEHA